MSDFAKRGKTVFLNLIVAIIVFFGVPLIAIGVGNFYPFAAMIWSGIIFLLAVAALYRKITQL
ncbi:MAG: hypothetical protein IIB64_10320, partial [Proteobacteria bacterium]|nr:hypothetical protein [Pseudomonadota bacterium]